MKKGEFAPQDEALTKGTPQQGTAPTTHAHQVGTEPARRTFLKRIALAMGGVAVGVPAFAKLSEDDPIPPISKDSLAETNGTQEVLFTPIEHDYASLTPERREAILQPRVMHVVIVTTEEAKAEVASLGGDFKAGTKKMAQYIQESFSNSGADLQCDVQCDDVEIDVIVIPRGEYEDNETQASEDAADYMNTNLTSGTFLDTKFKELASSKGIPREKLCPFLYVKNQSGGAITNYGSPGIVLDAKSALNPNENYEKWQRETGPHEFIKKIVGEHMAKNIGSKNHGFLWEVPRDNEGNLIYDFRKNPNDPTEAPIKEICTPSYTTKNGRRLMPHTSYNGKFVKLFDHNSQSYIEVPIGDENCDAWHNGGWDITLDKYTHNRETDTQAPELLSENGLAPMGVLPENDTTFDLEMNFNEDVFIGEGKIRLNGTYPYKSGEVAPSTTNADDVYHEFDASELIINGSNVLLPVSLHRFKEYTITVDEGVLVDGAGNKFAGITSEDKWVLETKDWATGAEDVEKPEFNVYPNPFTDRFTITNTDKVGRVQLSSMNGQILDQRENAYQDPSLEFNTQHLNLATGYYLLTLFDRTGKPIGARKMQKQGRR